MKHFVLFIFMIMLAVGSQSQVTYQTAQSGNYTTAATWMGGAAGRPPIDGTAITPAICNCKIVINAGHSLIINDNPFLTDASFVLDGASSNLTFDPGIDLSLFGTNSSIDLQSTQASITVGDASNQIFLGGEEIYDGSTTMFQSATLGTVQGLASASALRVSPQFQAGTLPVKLSAFSVAKEGSKVVLSWTTDLEVNSDHFEIERGSDGKDFNAIGSVKAAGNVSVATDYSYSDASPLQGTNYYRLKIVDIDTKFEYSPIKAVSFASQAAALATNPNPASSVLNVTVNLPGSEPFRLRLLNRSGQVVYDKQHPASINRLALLVTNYPEGSYFLEVTNGAGLKQVNKVVILRRN